MEMRSAAVLLVVLFALHLPPLLPGQRLVPPRRYHSDDDDDQQPELDDYEDEDDGNSTGTYLGASCAKECHPRLLHVYCNTETGMCECEKKFPVRLNPRTGCGRPKKLGEQCYYKETCAHYDAHSSCIQIHHNAICQCNAGYHSVSVNRPSKKLFCAEDLVVMTTDFSTLAGVVSGIAVLSGLICFVLKLFNQTLYSGRHRYGNANLAPPILFNSDADTSQPLYGSFLAVRDVTGSVPIIDRRLVSRASSQRTLASSSRRPSSAPGCRGVAVSASRAGAARAAAILLLSCHTNDFLQQQQQQHQQQQLHQDRIACTRFSSMPLKPCSRRPSVASVHSGNSIRSYSMRRYEKEREQKEEREMQRRLARLTSASANSSIGRIAPTPSPHSTDDLLPTLEEDEKQPVPLALSEESASTSFQEEVPSTSKQYP